MKLLACRRQSPGHELSAREIELLRAWIAGGAPYAQHWAFVAPQRPRPPVLRQDSVPQRAWGASAIDAFVLRHLRSRALEPAAAADRRTLLRRLSFDLTGLPPTLDELRAFAADEASDAYERAVDGLLASPHFGERWAAVWLDLARYADSSGYGSDPLREIWRYRDWVIEAFNANLPFDEFTRLQLAGDLVPEASIEDRLATAFHRNTMTNTEGGTDDEEFRVAAVKDRVDTTGQVWLGLTLGCASCHSHKFDPISQREYYQLFDFFNQTEDADKNDDRPRLATPTREQQARLEQLERRAEELERQLIAPDPALAVEQQRWEAQLARAWSAPRLDVLHSRAGTALRSLAPGELHSAAPKAPRDRFELTLDVDPAHPPTALRLEALHDPRLPRGGPGWSPENGNFVLSEIELCSAPRSATQSVRARRVRIDLPGSKRILSLAEVEVWSAGQNVALAGRARQSSTGFDGDAARAIDGNTSGNYGHDSVTHTDTEDDPWWELDLGLECELERVDLWNRTDGQLEARLAGAFLTVYDERGDVSWSTALPQPPDPEHEIDPREWRPQALLSDAHASFSQSGWEVEQAIDQDPASGWGIGPRQGQDHSATFRVQWPAGALERSGGRLTVALDQDYGGAHVLGALRLSLSTLDPPPTSMGADVVRALGKARAERSAQESRVVLRAFRERSAATASVRALLAEVERERAALKVPTTPVMRELPIDERRTTHVLAKGNFLVPLDEVQAATPSALHPWPSGGPHNRLGLARWLVAPDNPLTARVVVNRFWSRLFGRGLVESEEDFGSQGSLPTHPELLDWLAVEFVESGWDVKALLRQIVLSATYRQDSALRPELEESDPDNRLYARGPRFRLSAEAVRDQALALSGLLSRKLGGPSVYPPQPDGIWQAAFNGQRTWPTSQGEERYRRALYVFLRRTIPYPSLATFDAPSREVCTVRRIRTNTPLQAFVTLNDPVYVEAARALASRIEGEGGASVASRAAFGYELCTGQVPQPGAVERLSALYASESEHFRARPDQAQRLVALESDQVLPVVDLPQRAAWIVVANVLLNLDAVLVKR